MPLSKRAMINWDNFNIPVSYKVARPDRMRDARNVFTNQDVLETRHGISRHNSTAFSAAPQSISFFKENDGTRNLLVKDDSVLYKEAASGAHTSLKTGLTGSTKHRAVTFNNRHIIAIESDGLYQYDGTTFTQLGQAPPSAPFVAASGSGNTLTASDYQVAVTFYDSTNGFETNIGAASSTLTVASGQQIDVSSIPTTAVNTNIDKKRIYIKDITNGGDWLFWSEINLATTTATIDDDPTSAQTPPTTHAAPLSGGGKYIVVFGKKIAYAGNSSFQSDVYVSEEYLPDAFDDTSSQIVLNVSGQGPITGLAVGFFNDSVTDPYLVMFKKNRIEGYSEIGGQNRVFTISSTVGCVNHDTIVEINGDLYFMSTKGWRVISNGKLLKKEDRPFSLGDGDIDDIFTRSGYIYELNKTNLDNFFSVYYPTLDHYLTFVSEGSNTSIYKAYNYEFSINGFRPYEFPVYFTAACLGEDSNGREVIFLAGEGGYIYTHSVNETRTDVDNAGDAEDIAAFCQFYWLAGQDMDASYNFGPLILWALSQDTAITVKCFTDFSLQAPTNIEYDLSSSETGFILDISKLDEGVLGDGRTIVPGRGDILKSGVSLLIGFYQTATNGNMGLVKGQIDIQKNGNPN